MDTKELQEITRYIRYLILTASSRAGSGHPTSSLSAVELMTGLFFGGTMRYDINHPDLPANDRVVFSKGHATPLYYALWTVAGVLAEEEMMSYRQFDSVLEGHPTDRFRYVDAATGSLGQGLSIGVGLALNAKQVDKVPCRTYVLLGDSEMAEGAQWEAMQMATHYELHNLVGVLDINRLGQRGETMYGRDADAYARRIEAFGWRTRTIDGHSLREVLDVYEWAAGQTDAPCMILARTVKGKGVSFLEDRNGWHGKALDDDKLAQALDELGEVDRTVRGSFGRPPDARAARAAPGAVDPPRYPADKPVATRDAYGNALKRIYPKYPDIVSLDGEVCNSTRAEYFRDAHPDRFFEMYVAEQNMVGAAVGLSARGKIPFVSTFAAFLTRAFDQIRMAPYSRPNIKFVGSHAGVSIGPDGPSQMGLEDLAMFRTLPEAAVFYPCDAMSTERLVETMAGHAGIAYLRTTRGKTPLLYDVDELFPLGGCKVLRQSDADQVTVIAAGVTVHEALAAYENLLHDAPFGAGGPPPDSSPDKPPVVRPPIAIRVIDLYCIQPLDRNTLLKAAAETQAVITVEDHGAAGGLGEAVAAALADQPTPVHILAVRRRPRSGTTEEMLDYEGISRKAIAGCVRSLVVAR